jgi:ribosomal protein S21
MRKDREKQGLTVSVRGDDINGAMRVLKKRMQTEGIFNEMREKELDTRLEVKEED